MTTDPCAGEPLSARPNTSLRSSLTVDDLRAKLQVRLERHVDTAAFHPALTIVGFAATTTDVLRHGIDRPEDAILGFRLPAQYEALGVLASSVVATPPHRNHRDGALALAVSRSGDVVSMLATSHNVVDTHSPQGWLIDACHRALGLATRPCTVSPLAFPIALWLDRLMVAILNAPSDQPITWSDAVDLCPIPRRWRSTDAIDLGTTMGSTTRSWRSLRLAAAAGNSSLSGVSGPCAQWMDDAMFGRWCIGSFPDLNSLRSDVEFLASDQVAEQVATTLRAAWSAFAGGPD